ncbi:MAG: exodeoxyribonuclease VII large subunit [Clostridia bacterium]|nr:exodeoxyribonuclease VII large subunit [Clostridia bacterium]
MRVDVITVSQLNRYVKSLLEGDAQLACVYVSGEISNFVHHVRSGHLYLSLKDEGGLVNAVMFRAAAARLPFTPENGMKVIVRARVSLYERDGQYQIYIDEMQPDGVGALQLAYEQMKARLEKEGLFDAARKRPIPPYPRLIGVITSPTGAAVRDILNILGRRYPLASVVMAPVLVQGEEAPAQLVDALHRFNVLRQKGSRYAPDVLIIGRGGGSIEELWAFNDERVARAVAASDIPVISAVGHETDFTICDFAADLRAPTPSAAAELATPEQGQLVHTLSQYRSRMVNALQGRLQAQYRRLDALLARRCLKTPLFYVQEQGLRLDAATRAFAAAAKETVHRQQNRLATAAGKLDTLSPLKVLSRGYSIVSQNGRALRSVKDWQPEAPVAVRCRDGEVRGQLIQQEVEIYGNGKDL